MVGDGRDLPGGPAFAPPCAKARLASVHFIYPSSYAVAERDAPVVDYFSLIEHV